MFHSIYRSMVYRTLRWMAGIRPATRRIAPAVGILELTVAFGIAAFWVAFFAFDLVNIQDSRVREIYLAFETAFPLADLYLVMMLVIGGIGLLKQKPFGYVFSLMGGALLIFLGLLDVSFNAQQGIYLLGLEEAVFNIGINSLCIGFGVFLVLHVRLRSNRQGVSPLIYNLYR